MSMLMTVVGANPGRPGLHPNFDPVVANILTARGYSLRDASRIVRFWRSGRSYKLPRRDQVAVRRAADQTLRNFMSGRVAKRNPGILPTIIGGMVGAATTHALSNPAEGWVITRDGETVKTGFASDFDAMGWMHRRHGYSFDHAVRHEGYDLVLVRGGKVVWSYKRDGLMKGRPNPLSRREAGRILREARSDVRHARVFLPGHTRSEKSGQAFAKASVVHRYGPAASQYSALRVMDRAQTAVGTTMSNPGAGLKVRAYKVKGGLEGRVASLLRNSFIWAQARDGQVLTVATPEIAKKAIAHIEAGGAGWTRENPLTRAEAGYLLRHARRDVLEAGDAHRHGLTWEQKYHTGRARGIGFAVQETGPKAARKAWVEMHTKLDRAIRNNPGARLKAGDRMVLERIVGDLSVGASDLEVASVIRRKLSREKRASLVEQAVSYALKVHHNNQVRYRGISRDSFSPNPSGDGRRRKMTIPIERFAKMVRDQKNTKLWADFVRKVKGYHKWSHGTWPSKVTLEVIRKPGVSGIWITYDMGKQPESTYIMPKGAKRKGAWKHPWERMPEMKGDPEAGIILTKLGGKNRLTDFLHGN